MVSRKRCIASTDGSCDHPLLVCQERLPGSTIGAMRTMVELIKQAEIAVSALVRMQTRVQSKLHVFLKETPS